MSWDCNTVLEPEAGIDHRAPISEDEERDKPHKGGVVSFLGADGYT
jgi:hypothetical protein